MRFDQPPVVRISVDAAQGLRDDTWPMKVPAVRQLVADGMDHRLWPVARGWLAAGGPPHQVHRVLARRRAPTAARCRCGTVGLLPAGRDHARLLRLPRGEPRQARAELPRGEPRRVLPRRAGGAARRHHHRGRPLGTAPYDVGGAGAGQALERVRHVLED